MSLLRNETKFMSLLRDSKIPRPVRYVTKKQGVKKIHKDDRYMDNSRNRFKVPHKYRGIVKGGSKSNTWFNFLHDMERNMRVTRATSKIISDKMDESPSTSSSSEIDPLSKLLNYRYPLSRYRPKSFSPKTFKRRCKNSYYKMAELALKINEDVEFSTDDEFSDSTSDTGDTGDAEPVNTVNNFPSQSKYIDCSNLNNPQYSLSVEDLKKINIFESDSGTADETADQIKTTPVKNVTCITKPQPPKIISKKLTDPRRKYTKDVRDESLRPSPAKRQLFQVMPHQPRKRLNSALPSGENKTTKADKVDKTNTPSGGKQRKYQIEVLEDDDDDVIEIESQLGRLVFANLAGLQWWPGIIVKGSMCHLYTDNKGCSWIYWFGDHKVSLVSEDRIIPFVANFKEKSNGKGKMFQRALSESIRLIAERLGINVNTTTDDYLLEWAKVELKCTKGNKISKAESANVIPDWILESLSTIGEDILKKTANKQVPKSQKNRKQVIDNRENAIEEVKEGKRNIKDICIACSDLKAEIVGQHPLFKGGVCQKCKDDILETIYALDEDGKNAYCSICGHGGTLFLCDNDDCNRVFCVECINEMTSSIILGQIEKIPSWKCFLCTPYHKLTHGLLIPNHDWPQRVVQFFEMEMTEEMPSYSMFKEKRPVRVLSLFDGIGTGILVLKELGLEIEEYYASEIDPDAIMVTSVHHGDHVIQIGDITCLTETMISKLLPIDILLGASPCNDFSLANPDRKGFNLDGTGMLFFEFVRILEIIKKLQGKERHLFWLFENVASMKLEYKKVISRFLKCPAAVWNSGYFSAQNRSRYFWGNIPGLFSTPSISSHTHEKVTLNSLLTKQCNREATVDKLRTVTTRTNSLRLGKDDKGFPVKMDGVEAGIWIPELERVFGFPSHYTDVGNLPSTRRQKLLGKAWSVSALKNILRPLTEYFRCST